MWGIIKKAINSKLDIPVNKQLGSIYVGSTRYAPVLNVNVPDLGWVQTAPTNTVSSLGLSPDGAYIYSGGNDNIVRQIDTSDGSIGWTVTFSRSNVGIAVSNSGDYIYVGTDEYTGTLQPIVRQLVASTGANGWTYTGASGEGSSKSLAISPDDNFVYVGISTGIIRQINTSDGSAGWTFSGHTDDVEALIVSPDGNYVYSGSRDYTVKQINISDGSAGWTFTGHVYFVKDLAISSDGSYLYSASSGTSHSLKRINTSDGSSDWTYSTGVGYYTVDVSPCGEYLYFSTPSEIIQLKISTQETIWAFEEVYDYVVDSVLSPDGKQLYFGGQEDSIKQIKNLFHEIKYYKEMI